ncbi:MAG: Gfo/Idh/MocA family oxidoreductase [Formivibrio sp.]|nr:Gfo/Idh/MocA family oxidoreductase [Formivibrio sp.]
MIRIAVAGLGKMGISHLGMIRPHPDVELVAVCDTTGYMLDVLAKYTGMKTFTDYQTMLDTARLDALIIATPSKIHVAMVEAALAKGIHVFCEKPLTLSGSDAVRLTALAKDKGVVCQVGYHNRFVGTFREVKRLIDAGAIGKVDHVLAEAYGPVVLKPKGSTWRTQRSEGGGCLYDYAAHPLNLVNWYFGMPAAVGGSALPKIFSRDTDDAVYGTLFFESGMTGTVSVNWSDESYRKMSTKITITGTAGRIYADRQEIQVYARDAQLLPEGYRQGWNVRYITELTDEVYFYIRGEEYSAQLDYFVRRIQQPSLEPINDFASAAMTDQLIDAIIADAAAGPGVAAGSAPMAQPAAKRGLWQRITNAG